MGFNRIISLFQKVQADTNNHLLASEVLVSQVPNKRLIKTNSNDFLLSITEGQYAYHRPDDGTIVMFHNLFRTKVGNKQIKTAAYSHGYYRDLYFSFTDGVTVIFDCISKDSPLFVEIINELAAMNVSISDFYKFYFRLADINAPFSEEDREAFKCPNLTASTQATRFRIPVSHKNEFRDYYLVEKVGNNFQDTYILYFEGDVFYSCLVRDDNELAKQLVHSLIL